MYKKINGLKASITKIPLKQPVSYINLSDKILSEDEDRILTLDPKYSFGGKLDIKTVVAEREKITHLVEPIAKNEIRSILHINIKKFPKRPLNYKDKYHKTIKQLKQDTDITIIKTDKTNKLAIINKNDYITKMQKCISEMGCKQLRTYCYHILALNLEIILSFGNNNQSIKIYIKLSPIIGIIYK